MVEGEGGRTRGWRRQFVSPHGQGRVHRYRHECFRRYGHGYSHRYGHGCFHRYGHGYSGVPPVAWTPVKAGVA